MPKINRARVLLGVNWMLDELDKLLVEVGEKPAAPAAPAAAPAAHAPAAAKAPKAAKVKEEKAQPPPPAEVASPAQVTNLEKIAAHVCAPHAMHLDPAKYKPVIVANADCYYCKQAKETALSPEAQAAVLLDLKSVTAKAKELVEKRGKPKLAEVLKTFGVAAVTPGPGKVSLPESEYINFYEMCTALIEGEDKPSTSTEEEPL